MQIYDTDRIDIRVRYDLEKKQTKGEVYSKIEEKQEVLVGYVVEEDEGNWSLWLASKYAHKDYIKEDCEKLKSEFVGYANMWKERTKHGSC